MEDASSLNGVTRGAWEANASGRNEKMPDGNRWLRELIWPSAERLLALERGKRFLDVACGNGVAARAMVAKGANVTAFDFSPARVEAVGARGDAQINYAVADAKREVDLVSFGEAMFDAAHAGMAVSDIADMEPLFRIVHAC